MPQQFYRMNLKRLTFAECRRFQKGFAGGLLTWLLLRLGLVPAPGRRQVIGVRDLLADRQDLPSEIAEWMDKATAPSLDAGYRLVAYQAAKPGMVSADNQGSYGCILLSSGGDRVVTLNLVRQQVPNSTEVKQVLGFNVCAFFTGGRCYSVTSNSIFMDPASGCRVLVDKSENVKTMEKGLEELLAETRERPVCFHGTADVIEMFVRAEERAFVERVKRGLFILEA